MNPLESLILGFQELVAQVPEFLQPFIVMLAGAVPFIEGEGASPIGVVGGINPIVAGVAAATGNFLAVLVVVLLGSRVREAAAARRARRVDASPVPASARVGSPTAPIGGVALDERPAPSETTAAKPESKGRQRIRRLFLRFGVPGASLLGPLAIPTHFTAAILVASGASKGWVLLWQAIAITLWTSALTTLVWGAMSAVLAAG